MAKKKSEGVANQKSPEELLKEARKQRRSDNHVAEGEHTGHFHGANGEGVAVYDGPMDGVRVLEVPNGANLTHQEHKAISIAPGTYITTPVQEYDPFAETIRNVRD